MEPPEKSNGGVQCFPEGIVRPDLGDDELMTDGGEPHDPQKYRYRVDSNQLVAKTAAAQVAGYFVPHSLRSSKEPVF